MVVGCRDYGDNGEQTAELDGAMVDRDVDGGDGGAGRREEVAPATGRAYARHART